jgi:uncharacterized protein involved in exopolysaccharide biosynthesis
MVHTQKFVAGKVNLSRGEIKDRTIVEENASANSIAIKVLDTDQMRALWITQRYIEALRSIHRDLSIPTRESQVTRLSGVLNARQKELAAAEDELQDFQMRAKTGVSVGTAGAIVSAGRFIDLLREKEIERQRVGESLKSVRRRVEAAKGGSIKLPNEIPTAKPWREKLAQLEYELKVAEISAGPMDPQVVRLKAQIEITRRELNSAVSEYVSAVRQGLVDPSGETGVGGMTHLSQTLAGLDAEISALRRLADVAPQEATTYQRLIAKVTTLGKLAEQARVQHDQARAEADSDPNRWEVLDTPEVSDQPVNKNYVRNVAVGAVVSLIVGLGFILARPNGRESA